ncbi:hypothetical protein HDU98_002887, partial [Podochytrium sp. JEL0797]
MFSLFQDDATPTTSDGSTAFPTELCTTLHSPTDTDQVFFDWQGSLCGGYDPATSISPTDNDAYTSLLSQVDDAFMAALNAPGDFTGYFAQTGVLPTDASTASGMGVLDAFGINPQFMRVPENADSPHLQHSMHDRSIAPQGNVLISMADVLPQTKLSVKKVTNATPAAKPKEKKVVKDKGGISKSHKKAATKNLTLLPKSYGSLMQLASAADHGNHNAARAAVVPSTITPAPIPSVALPADISDSQKELSLSDIL